ncbi:helicase associated domain-containing protein, partial [Streptomyces pimonensis]
DWQRHYRVLADLVEDEPGGVLPDIQPGVLMDGDDIGRWLQRQKNPGTWKLLSTEQQKRLTALGIKAPSPAPAPAPAEATPVAAGAAKVPGRAGSKAQAAFQRGLAALAQWVERESSDRPVPRGHSEEITVDGEAEPVTVKLGVWVSNTRARRDRLTTDQLAALAELGMDWARPVTVPQPAPDSP